ncbi:MULTISPECIES: penicillin acylase family protein [Caldilinea]|jgi:penicillin amidase|uniref:Peptidase S45 family protein n=1 Tax=Caldilinea aerophila (strain DSM 14535 / JCM 11387 / NBRC 104270 / STL-6-O1) TaxID=926550 RepID=I0I5D8_CALAS|nr:MULTISPECIES: penicillin acylase family protein [Caldilinea]BAM00476.1 peptidase S45 family protein [Caldilinea aerophila DSM 14535 = NBRC 104270]GIV71827.1 MAG: peptidase S45 [Caldilinea sp.]
MTIPSIVIALLIVLLILVLLGAALFLHLYWWRMQRAAPKLDGTVKATGFDQPVEILRDKHGVPHIYAQTEADLYRALGWVHAQDRFWQMEQARRTAQGRLAEIFGEPALDADRFCRIIGFQRAAEADEAALDAETHQLIAWYVEGVNAYLAARPGRVSAEHNLLRVPVEPWRVVDTLAAAKVLAWSMSGNWQSELTRLLLHQRLDAYSAANLEPDYPAEAPIVMAGVGSAEQMRLQSAAGLLLSQYEQVRQWLGGEQIGQGSNSWVLAPKRSLNRRPLLCADPHLNVQLPAMVYEAHLSGPDTEVSGMTFPGMPGVFIGHNNSIAWGLTNAQVDTQDLFIERMHPEQLFHFAKGAQWEEAQVLDETIQVRRGAPHTERIVITRHGPLINGFIRQAMGSANSPIEETWLALQWTGHFPGTVLTSVLKLNRAEDWQEFRKALALWTSPPQNVTYADARGNIGYQMAGRVPRRGVNLGLVPAPGWSPDFDWQGWIPVEELPHLYNPESGVIVTANNKIVGDDYPHFLGLEFDPGWRAARIEQMIAEKERFTIRDMEEMQQDTGSLLARAFLPWFTLLYSEDPWEKVALQALRKWNWRMDTDSAAALIFHYLLENVLDMTFGDKLGAALDGYRGVTHAPLFQHHPFRLRAETRLLQILSEHDASFWYNDVASGRTRDRLELLQEALTRSMKMIRRTYGDSMLRWAWGKAHQVRFTHPLGAARLIGGFFSRAPLPVGGDATTPYQTRAAPGLPPGLIQVIPVYRQILEVGAWDRAQSVLAGGQSGHPLSRLYDDQIMMWREGVYHLMPWSRPAVEKAAVHRLVIMPQGTTP